MRDTKWEFIPFSFYDRSGMEAHLEGMAARGWFLERISPFGWFYRAGPPKAVRYGISFFPGATDFDPGPTEAEADFRDFCRHSGWELAASTAQYQVFRNFRENPVPLETDPTTELRAIGRAAKKALPVLWILLGLGLWLGGSWCYSLFHDPIGLLSSPAYLFTGLCWLCLGVYALAELAGYLSWRRRAKAAAERGEFVPTHGHHRLLLGLVGLMLLSLAGWAILERMPGMRFLFLGFLLVFALLLLLQNAVRSRLRRRGASARVNRAATLGSTPLFSTVLLAAVFLLFLQGIRSGPFSAEALLTPPVAVEELTGIEDSRYIHGANAGSSALLTRQEFHQWVREDETCPELELTVVDVHVPGLYELCLRQLLGGGGVSSDPAPWGANAVYMLPPGADGAQGWVLCWDGRLAALAVNWNLTAEQMATAGSALAPAAQS